MLPAFIACDSLWPIDALWWHRSGSTLDQIMAITWTNVDLSSMGFSGKHLRAGNNCQSKSMLASNTHKHTHTQWKDNRHSLFLWLNKLFHRSYARIMGEVSFGDIWYILSQCHAKGSRLIMQLNNHGRGCTCFILALPKLNKGIYIVMSWNNGSAVLILQNDNQTLCYAVSLNVLFAKPISEQKRGNHP